MTPVFQSRLASMLPRVSVVIPFRDARRWLPEALASVAAQEGVDIELVAVDDGSSDGSTELVQRHWAGVGGELILLQAGGHGVSGARNLGWRASSSPFVAFLDADDLCLPGRLAGQAGLLSQHPHLAHVHSGWQRIDSRGRLLKVVTPWREGAGFSVDQAFRHKAILPSAWMLRRSALEACGGFDPALSQAEDVDLLLRLALAGFEGEWWRRSGCAYRVHPQSASGQARPQARALLWVISRQLRTLPRDPGLNHARLELLYTTRAWAGWNAWRCGESDLAFELWRTSLGLSPMPAALTWTHLAENVVRSAAREGKSLDPQELMVDPTWLRLQRHFIDNLTFRQLSMAPLPSPSTAWERANLALVRGRFRDGLALWREILLHQLGPDPETSPWHPRRMIADLSSDDPILSLRRDVLGWCEALLGFQGNSPKAEQLARELAALLWRWACLTWLEDRRPTAGFLEQSCAIWPNTQALQGLARLHRHEFPTGAIALQQLAEELPPLKEAAPFSMPCTAAFWERKGNRPDRCNGPACPPCYGDMLKTWRQQPLGSVAVLWLPPREGAEPNPRQATACHHSLAVHELLGGQAWIRPPEANPWGLTHAVGVATASGEVVPHLSRRYPTPWASCRQAAPMPEPIPGTDPLTLQGTVLAVADLSAEGYYHWLLEAFPRLGLALEAIEPTMAKSSLRVWHNGGAARFVQEGLQEILGLASAQLIDARQHPHIRAERLLVPAFTGPFGWPPPSVQEWLRQHLLPAPHARQRNSSAGNPPAAQARIWLGRPDAARRPVWGQKECLRHLEAFDLLPLDPGGLSLTEQAGWLAAATCVVAPHGAALANLVFASPGTRVLELHQSDYAPPYFHALAAERELLLARCVQTRVPPALYRSLLYEGPIVEPIVLEPQKVAEALEALLEVPASLPWLRHD